MTVASLNFSAATTNSRNAAISTIRMYAEGACGSFIWHNETDIRENLSARCRQAAERLKYKREAGALDKDCLFLIELAEKAEVIEAAQVK